MKNTHHYSTSIFTQALTLCFLPMVLCCEKSHLKPLAQVDAGVFGYVSLEAQFCTSKPAPAKQNLKYLFILDHSNSNKPQVNSTGDSTNTDPIGSRRYGPLVNFVNNLVADPNNPTYFDLIDFNDSSTGQYDPNGATSGAEQLPGISGFTSDSVDFTSKVTTDWIGSGNAGAPSPVDGGFTDYRNALKAAYQVILKDAQVAASIPGTLTSTYQIIFVSDGAPEVPSSGSTVPQPWLDPMTNDGIKVDVENLENLKNDVIYGPWITNINLNTAYYSNGTASAANEAAARTMLQNMATSGNGQFIEFTSGQNILYQRFAPPSRNLHNVLADVFIENKNGIWWDDGKFYLDSDADGIPDIIETKLGSNPLLSDSDGNGVSDLVEYRTKGKICDGLNCSATGRDSYSRCAGYGPTTDSTGKVTFKSSSNDGLNDCEKFLMGANPIKFNTNGNYIPDAFAVRSNLPVLPGSAGNAFADPFGNGITNYNKLKLGFPVQVSATGLTDFSPREILIYEIPSDSYDSSCYQLNAEKVAISAMTNTIRLMLIQNNTAVQDKPFLLKAEKSMDGGSAHLIFNRDDFK